MVIENDDLDRAVEELAKAVILWYPKIVEPARGKVRNTKNGS